MQELANLLAKMFISRPDVKAVQTSDGIYMPDGKRIQTANGPQYVEYYPWTRAAIEAHLSGEKTYGHYLLSKQNECKVLAFDIDLNKDGKYPTPYDHTAWDEANRFLGEIEDLKPREAWLDRRHPARGWMKLQMKTIAARLASGIVRELEIPCAVAYTGAKGLHVYGFLGKSVPASDAREGARIVIDSLGDWKPTRGDNFYACEDADPVTGYPNFQIEVFPKQDTLGHDGGLGNLMRMPLGRNKKNPKDPTFFVDMTTALTELKPVDPVWALTSGNPFESR